MQYFFQQLINGLTLGSIYGLIAIGYTMVYGIIGMINFAHGDIFMIGAFVALIVYLILIAMFLRGPWHAAVDHDDRRDAGHQPLQLGDRKSAYRPARFVPAGPLITAIGMLIALPPRVGRARPRNKPIPLMVCL
jgi:branched-chain amino acid transport system permease protein